MFGKRKKKDTAEAQPAGEKAATTRLGADRVFGEGLGDVWLALTGRNPAAIMPQVVGTVLHDGGTRPAWQWKRQEREFVLMAWPREQLLRAAVLMSGEEGGKLSPVTAVPLLEGLPNDLEVDSARPRAEGAGGDVAVFLQKDQNPMWFFDPLYNRDQDDLTPGVTHTFLLSAAALAVRKALLDEVAITDGPEFAAHAQAWLEKNPDKSRLDVPPLKIPVKDKHFVMPGRRFGEYQLRAKIEKVEDAQLENMPVKALYLRFPFDRRPPLHIALFASRFVLGDYEPAEGEEIEAYAWFQGRIIDMDRSAPGTPASGPDAAGENYGGQNS